MSSSLDTSNSSFDPHALLAEIVVGLTSTTLQLALGLLAGVILARVMRRRHLHWSWAASALCAIAIAHTIVDRWSVALLTATLCATARGRHWHREDLAAGGDLAVLAEERLGPLDVARMLTRTLSRRIDVRARRSPLHRDHMVLGRTNAGAQISIPFGVKASGRHTLVVGATGSGKTVTETWIAGRAVEAGLGAVIVDPKGDARMREQLERAARLAGRPFVEWTPYGPAVYNPFAHGSASEIADKALAGERFTEPHYQRQAQRYLGHAVRALRDSGSVVSLPALVEQLDPTRLEELIGELPDEKAHATGLYLESLTARQRTDLVGVRDRLAIMAESDVAPWLDPATPTARTFDLLGAIRERAIVYFDLRADAWPLLAHMLGAAIVQDLQTVVASLQGGPVPTLVVIDEFSAIAAEQVVRLFGRARSAGFSLLLGTQELSDLRLPGRERLLEQVLGNLSALIAHRQVVPSSAELIANVAGSRGAWKVSRHSEGRTTRVRIREPVLDADRVMSLGRGWAAVLVLGGGASARVARMFNNHKKEDR